MREIKLQCGEVIQIPEITWKVAKKMKLMSIFSKYTNPEEVNIDEEDIEKVVSAFVDKEILENKMSFPEVLDVFNTILEMAFNEKKQK